MIKKKGFDGLIKQHEGKLDQESAYRGEDGEDGKDAGETVETACSQNTSAPSSRLPLKTQPEAPKSPGIALQARRLIRCSACPILYHDRAATAGACAR